MKDPELLAQRRLVEETPGDPLLLYRYRVAAARSGARLHLLPGDRVRRNGDEGTIVEVVAQTEGPPQLSLRVGKKLTRADAHEVTLAAPHKPAALLGEADFAARVAGDLADPHAPEALEALAELERRAHPDAIAHAIDLLPAIDDAPSGPLRQALARVLRSRPFGEVEVALQRRQTPADERELVDLATLATVAPGEREANEILDRLEALEEPAQGVRIAVRAGKAFVGLGAPGFARAEVRQRVAELSRTHPDKDVRVALFVHCVPALQGTDLLEQALGSDDPAVRTAAACEFIRRGTTAPAFEHLAGEADPDVALAILNAAPRGVPVSVLEALLNAAGKHAALQEAALLRLAEVEPADADAALALLAPWLEKGRKTNAGAAIWTAGLIGSLAGDPEATGAQVLARMAQDAPLARVGLGVEALARLGHPAAVEALQAFGVALLELGPWGEELVDATGVLLAQGGDAREVLGRFLVTPPTEPTRAARALDVAACLVALERVDLARAARRLLPSRLARFADLEGVLAGG